MHRAKGSLHGFPPAPAAMLLHLFESEKKLFCDVATLLANVYDSPRLRITTGQWSIERCLDLLQLLNVFA